MSKKQESEPMDQSRLRERAVLFARSMELSEDLGASIDHHLEADSATGTITITPENGFCVLSVIRNPVQFKIGIDNMVASGFEMGYAAALDDLEPRRALRDAARGQGALRRLFRLKG